MSRNYSQIASESVIIFTLDILIVASSGLVDQEAMTDLGFGIIGILGLYLVLTQGSALMMSGK